MTTIKVNVKQGTVIGGKGVLPNGSDYNFFKGIPYAVAPLGELRFQAPVPLGCFSKPEIDCTETNKNGISIQRNKDNGECIGSEDCLVLNVYTPKIDDGVRFPVMVYIHGGAFLRGSGNSESYNPLYLLEEGVVVVTLNYRLGVLGFLSFPEGGIPGNNGLKDQRLALQWIQENISQFSGDPKNVTLFGQSAGAMCARMHVLSENSNKLFHKAILQSGVYNKSNAFESQASMKTRKFAQNLGCESENPQEIVNFLRNYNDLSGFVMPLPGPNLIDEIYNGPSLPVRPVVEVENPEAVFTNNTLKSMNQKNSIEMPLIIGTTSAEGILFLPAFLENLKNFDENLIKVVPKDIFKLTTNSPDLANTIRELYFEGKNLNEETLNHFVELLTDLFFNVSAFEIAEMHSKTQHKEPLYCFYFDFNGGLNLHKKKFKMENLKGACHADDINYIFQTTTAPEPWNEKDKNIVLTMCKMWANFAKHSKPTLCDKWKPVEKIHEKEQFTFDTFLIGEDQRMTEIPNAERINFWRNLKKGSSFNPFNY